MSVTAFSVTALRHPYTRWIVHGKTCRHASSYNRRSMMFLSLMMCIFVGRQVLLICAYPAHQYPLFVDPCNGYILDFARSFGFHPWTHSKNAPKSHKTVHAQHHHHAANTNTATPLSRAASTTLIAIPSVHVEMSSSLTRISRSPTHTCLERRAGPITPTDVTITFPKSSSPMSKPNP